MQTTDHKFATAHLWAAMADIPHLYSIKAAKGALRALEREIERAEAGLPPLMTGDHAERVQALRGAVPTLCAECPLEKAA